MINWDGMKTIFERVRIGMHMKRTKFKTGILAVVFCSLTFLFSGDGNSIYADEILTDTELPSFFV